MTGTDDFNVVVLPFRAYHLLELIGKVFEEETGLFSVAEKEAAGQLMLQLPRVAAKDPQYRDEVLQKYCFIA